MAYGETAERRAARLERQRAQYPELSVAEPSELADIDRRFRARGEPPTSFGTRIEEDAAALYPDRGEFVAQTYRPGQGVVRTGGATAGRRGLFGSLADVARDVVPQGVRDTLGSGLRDFTSGERFVNAISDVLGEPAREGTLGGWLADRGLEVPAVPGYKGRQSGTRIAEAAEATGIPGARAAFDVGAAPATWASAGIGPGAAARIKNLPLIARIPANIAAPASRSANFGTRLAAETAIGTAATVGAQKTAERTDNPWLVALAGLGAGVAASGAVSAAPALGRGLKAAGEAAASPGPLRPGEAVQVAGGAPSRVGLITSMPDTQQLTAQLGRAPEVRDIFQIDRVGRREVTSVANRLRAQAEIDFRTLGKTATENGNVVLRDVAPDAADAARGYKHAPLVKVLEKPGNYALTPDQAQAVARLGSVPKAIADERKLAGVGPRMAAVADDEQFMWRKGKVTSKGVEIPDRGGGTPGTRLGGGGDKSRVFADIDEALEAKVQYAHPLEAFDQNVTRGLKKVVDERVKGLLEPLSETAAQRVSPALRAKHDALVQRLTSLRATGGRLDARIAGIVDAYTNSAAPDIDALFDELQAVKVGLNAVGKQGPNFGKSAAQMRREINAVQQQIRAMQPDWRREIRLARQVPAGRSVIPMEVAPGLAGRDFDPQVAQRIEDYYRRNARIRLPFTDKSLSLRADLPAVRAVSAVITPIKATGDLSGILMNNVTNVARHPVTFAKNVALGFRDMVDDANYNRWLTSGVSDDAARSGVSIAGPAGEKLEFQFSNWMDRFPGLKQVNNHYTRFNNRMRVDMFNQEVARQGGAAVDEATREGIARAVNRFTGVSNSRATDIETLASFAPNFTRAHVESVAKALSDGTIEGRMAREHLATMLAAGGALVLGTAVAQDRDPSEVLSPFDLDTIKRGELRLNPNFMSVRVAGQDVKVFGKYDSLFRLMTVIGDSAMRAAFEQNPSELFDAVGYYTGSQGAPAISWITSAIMGETFSGESPTSLKGVAEQVTPISAPNVAKSLSEGNIPAAVIQGIGGKASPLSAREQVEAGQYASLKGMAQLDAIRPQAWKMLTDATGIEADSYYDWYQAEEKRITEQFTQAFPPEFKGQALLEAQRAMSAHPIVKLHTDIKQSLGKQWAAENPEGRLDLLESELAKDEPRIPAGVR